MERLVWMDGTLVTAEHFLKLESWIQELVGKTGPFQGTAGLIKGPHEQIFNKEGFIQLRNAGVNGGQVEFKIGPFRCILPSGELFENKQELIGRCTIHEFVGNRAVIYLSLLGGKIARRETGYKAIPESNTGDFHDEIDFATPISETPEISLSEINRTGYGLPIAELVYNSEKKEISQDDNFIPPCVTMGSFNALMELGAEIINKIDRLIYGPAMMSLSSLKSLSASANGTNINTMALALLIANNWLSLKHIIQEKAISPARFFGLLADYFEGLEYQLSMMNCGNEAIGQYVSIYRSKATNLSDLRMTIDAALNTVESFRTTVESALNIVSERDSRIPIKRIQVTEPLANHWRIEIEAGGNILQELQRVGSSAIEVLFSYAHESDGINDEVRCHSFQPYRNILPTYHFHARLCNGAGLNQKYGRKFSFIPDREWLNQSKIVFWLRERPAVDTNNSDGIYMRGLQSAY